MELFKDRIFYDAIFFWGAGGSATIKHRCVTHLYGSNASEQLAVDSTFNFQLKKAAPNNFASHRHNQ